jgi:SAM-dependent methyltransferase
MSLKLLVLNSASTASLLWRLLPSRLRGGLIFGIFVMESRQKDPSQGLRRLFYLRDRLELVINERAMVLGAGEHPKHRLTRYHDFFIERVVDGQRVLDIGCGYGAVARSIARARVSATVLGVDQDRHRLIQARSSDNPPNLTFLEADATRDLPEGGWDVVVLSNVLEHIADRVGFLRAIIKASRPTRVLIRVPLFERDWQLPMRRELEVCYFSDPDHKIEHTIAEFRSEMTQAGLRITEIVTLWGEIWAECKPECVGS